MTPETIESRITTDDEGIHVDLSFRVMVESLTPEAKRTLLAELASDDDVFGWVVDQLAIDCFVPDESKPALFWCTDGDTIDRARARFDASLPELARTRIADLQREIDRAYRDGVHDMAREAVDDLPDESPRRQYLWRMCIQLTDDRPTAVKDEPSAGIGDTNG